MPPISKPEVRFKENSGERYTNQGKVRCHALSKSKIKLWREEFEDYDTPTDDLWPECQCHLAAIEGQYVCRFHGGLTPRTVNPPRTILDVMPMDMAEKFKAVMNSPDYISRKDDINLMQLRRNLLLEELNEEADSKEVWGLIHEAIVKLQHGDSLNALDYLERAVKIVDSKEKVWNEIYRVEKLLGDITTVQMKTAKDLQSMATTEQVNALMSTLINLINSGAKSYISNPMDRSQFQRTLVSEIQRLMGVTPQEMISAEQSD